MCLAEWESARWQETHGRPCAYVMLDARNADAVALVNWSIHDDLKPMLSQYATLKLRHLSPDERERTLERVAFALRSQDVAQRLHPTMLKKKDD